MAKLNWAMFFEVKATVDLATKKVLLEAESLYYLTIPKRNY